MEKKKIIRKKKTAKKHIVIFQDRDQNVLQTLFVPDGESVTPPKMKEILEEKEHHRVVFRGWNQDLSHIHSNLVVCPVTEEVPREYLVMYFHENGKILGSETVPYGQDARAAIIPVKEDSEEFEYHFSGWSCRLQGIDGDRMAKARFHARRKRFTVRFFDGDGELIQENSVYYGESASTPVDVKKAEDATYFYHFDRWDRDFERITEDRDIHAVFWKEYKEYPVRFYEEDKCIEETYYHYHDRIRYPQLQKKGYEFVWNQMPDQVEDETEIHGRWAFSNYKGKCISTDQGEFQILNPSISAGSVRCLRYHSNDRVIRLPERVKLGDYYYSIRAISRHAFAECDEAYKIICPSCLRELERECFAENKKLRELDLGDGIQRIEEKIFADCSHLKVIRISSRQIKCVDRAAFDKMNHRLECIVAASMEDYYKKKFMHAIREKGMQIKTV